MTPAPQRTTRRLLIVSPDAGGVTNEVRARLRATLTGYTEVEFNPRKDFRRGLSAGATVVVAGGDGTIGFVARALAGSRRRLGLLALGTYNNFAHGLGIPEDVDGALAVIRAGRTRRVTLGRINGRHFLEVAAIGMFGEAIVLGDAAKDRALADVAKGAGAVAGAERFTYTITGDIRAQGSGRSLVFTNAPSTGARIAVGKARPGDPFLELAVGVGDTRSDIVGRLLAATVGDRHEESDGMSLQFTSLRIQTSPRVSAFADNQRAGRTPLTVSAHVGALRVIVP